jgi:sugar/nucleoside kinase (ribokinase family)
MSILVVGSVAYDGIETPFASVDRTLGGSATFISLSASYFHSDIRLVGVVGNDFHQDDLKLFKSRKIDLEGLQHDHSGKTFFWRGRYHFDMNSRDTLETQLNVFANFDPVIPNAYKNADFVCLGNIEPGLQRKVLMQIERPKLIVADTMNFWIEGARESLLETLKMVDLLIINDSEARELSGMSSLVKAAAAIRAMGPKMLIIKKGEHGALLFAGGEIFSAPAYPIVDIFDPTGAGDTFLGGFTGWLAKTNDISTSNLRRAVIYGSVMASFCVEKFGTERLRELTAHEIKHRYHEFIKLSEVPAISMDW